MPPAHRVAALIVRLRNPSYTGPNRCVPCTAVNLAVAAGLTVAAALVWPPAAVVVAVGSLAAIWLRGYLVPGTPALTRRYLPEWLLARFDRSPRAEASEWDVEAVLRELGVVIDVESEVLLDPEFARELRTELHVYDGVVADEERVAELLGVATPRVYVTARRAASIARLDGIVVAHWESQPAFAADFAADRVLRARDETWVSMPIELRREVLGGLRVCMDRCPVCGGTVEIDLDVVESCCRPLDVIAGTCTGCDARLFEVAHPPDELATVA